MSEAIITVENLGKKYLLRHQRKERYTALRDVLSEKAKNLFRGRGRNRDVDSTREEFWALKDVNFEVKQGEVVGIIGRNGAGKSTLLKILSRITEPTTGKVRIKGRVASLLEVGTGFHPELTGRENIFLNGAILGMGRAEIKSKFDEIVAFAEIEKFLDTPVKRYSSGMYVRLAFAVAAHLEPEILIIDEVLAVGDADFQKKCLGKMTAVSRVEGRTILFVSHNMAAISALTQRTLLLSKGLILTTGNTREVIETYQKSWSQVDNRELRRLRTGAHSQIRSAELIGRDGKPTPIYTIDQAFMVHVVVETDGSPNLSLDLMLASPGGEKLAMASMGHFEHQLLPRQAGVFECDLAFSPMLLASGSYSIDVITAVINHDWDEYVEAAIVFDVPYSAPNGASFDFQYSRGYGAMALLCVREPQFKLIEAPANIGALNANYELSD